MQTAFKQNSNETILQEQLKRYDLSPLQKAEEKEED